MVKTKVRPSSISGMGLFADQDIAEGEVVWKLEPSFDVIMTAEGVQKLSKPAQEQFHNYAYLDKELEKYVLCSDDGRFFNHAPQPNCDDRRSEITLAFRDIRRGEELTVNYKDFYGDIEDHPEIP